MLKTRPKLRNLRWLFLGLALLVAGQVMEAGHLHEAGSEHLGCVQCQSDSGQAGTIAASSGIAHLYGHIEDHPEIAAAPAATFYKIAARGPPLFFS